MLTGNTPKAALRVALKDAFTPCWVRRSHEVFSPRPPVFMDFIAQENKIRFGLNMTDLFSEV